MDDLAISGNSIHPEQTEIIMYQTEDGLTKIDVRMENETVWLTQAQMAELFQRERSGTVLSGTFCMLLAEGTARSRNRKGVSRIACSS